MPKEPTTAMVPRMDTGALIQAAIENKASVETMERLFALAKDVRAENAREAWHHAMTAFQGDAPEIVKSKTANVQTATGSRYSYKYAPLDAIIPLVRPILSKHGLSVTFETTVGDNVVIARCKVAHELGHVESCEFSVPVDLRSRMNPAQQVASARTYACRYAYVGALGLAPEDDDDGQSSNGATVEKDQVIEVEATRDPFDAPADPVILQKPPAPKQVTGVITHVEEKVAKTGKPYYRITLDGNVYTTFHRSVEASAMIAWNLGVPAVATLKPYKDGFVIEAVEYNDPPFGA